MLKLKTKSAGSWLKLGSVSEIDVSSFLVGSKCVIPLAHSVEVLCTTKDKFLQLGSGLGKNTDS